MSVAELRRQLRSTMRSWALLWRAEMKARGKTEHSEKFLRSAIGWRNQAGRVLC